MPHLLYLWFAELLVTWNYCCLSFDLQRLRVSKVERKYLSLLSY